MSNPKPLRLVGRTVVLTIVGMAISLVVGTLISLAPESPLEGLYGGVFVAGSLLVLTYFFIVPRRRGSNKKIWTFELHSILGLVTGILLSVIFLSGVLLLYRAEIEIFGNSWLEIETGDVHKPVDEWIDAVHTRTDLNTSNRIELVWPERHDYPVRIDVNQPNGTEQYFVNPYNAEVLNGTLKSSMDWIREFHVSFNLGALGHWITGVVALVAIWLCISGLTMGRSVFREWYLLRWRKGIARFLSDLHKRFGLWLLPFIAINSFAGMLAALFGVFSAGPTDARFGGNYGALYEAVGSPQSIERSEPYAMPSMSHFIGAAQIIMPNAGVQRMRILKYGDRNAVVSIRASRRGDITPDGTSLLINFRASSGEVLLQREFSKAGFFERISNALAAFHVAQYGGLWVRPIHAITAILVSFIPFVGMAMWLLRRRGRQLNKA